MCFKKCISALSSLLSITMEEIHRTGKMIFRKALLMEVITFHHNKRVFAKYIHP